jgi:hypothetical protein
MMRKSGRRADCRGGFTPQSGLWVAGEEWRGELAATKPTPWAPSLGFEREAFAGDEDGGGRCDAELPGVVALIDGNANAAARIDVKQRIADGNFHESFDIRQGDGLLVEEQWDFVAEWPRPRFRNRS